MSTPDADRYKAMAESQLGLSTQPMAPEFQQARALTGAAYAVLYLAEIMRPVEYTVRKVSTHDA